MTLAAAAVTGATAVNPSVSVSQGTEKVQTNRATAFRPVKSETLADGVVRKTISSHNGRHIKKLDLRTSDTSINPMQRKTRARVAGLPEGVSFYEGFEDCDLTVLNWIPEGWSTISNGDPELEDAGRWGVMQSGGGFGIPSAPEGDFMMSIGYSMGGFEQDEWLVLPTLKVSENEQFKFNLSVTPMFFYECTGEYVDWDNMVWISEPVAKGDLYVMARVGDGEWKQIWSMLDQFSGWSFEEISVYDEFAYYIAPLDEYAGQEVQLAFRYKAQDCNTIFLDCVSIGLPALEDISFMNPLETLYWGFDRSDSWRCMTLNIAQYPVYGPLTWQNTSYADATYSWTYHDPVTNDLATSNDQYELTVTYEPDYTSEFTRRNNFYYPPVLTATASGATDGSCTMVADYLAAGGKPEFETTYSNGSKELIDFGLLPFNINTDGYGITTIDAQNVGDIAFPIFGYNCNSDKFWLDYTLNGEEPSEGDDVKLVSILNFIYAPSAPMAVTGVHVNGVGKVSENAEFKIEIIPCDDKYQPMEEAIATAVCSGADFVRTEPDALPYQLLMIPFDFDVPAVLDANEHMAYIVKLSGFNSPEVETFIPLQSLKPNADYLCHGWLEKMIKIDSDFYRNSYSPMANFEGQYGECYNAFCIALDGYYPWLESDVNEVTVAPDGTAVEINLGSYYDGSELSIESVMGITAEISGRYDKCVLSIRHDDTEAIADGNLVISAPGVRKSIKVTETVSVDSIESVSADIEEVYSIDGKRLQVSDLTSGVYVVRYTDGKTRRIIVR